MKKEDADQFIKLFDEYFKDEIEMYKRAYHLSDGVEDQNPQNLFCNLMVCEGKFAEFTKEMERLWMDHIIWTLVLKNERHKHDRD